MNFWQKAQRFPPVIIRLLASPDRSRRPWTSEEIAQRCSLSVDAINVISSSTSWRGIDLETMRQFCLGCGLDFENRTQFNRATVYLRKQMHLSKRQRSSWLYLRRSKDWSTLYGPLMRSYLESLLK